MDQFTKQATPFAEKLAHSQDTALQLMTAMTGVSLDDTVLDVACGPGLVTCFFATRAKHATGIDITPAMIDEAKQLQIERGLKNITWQVETFFPCLIPTNPFPSSLLDIHFIIFLTHWRFLKK
ncbi:MAG TPA: class I SAM-dependent methyltransferase [Nitrospirota bacterium]|nr:class I SAM-dependent methyltransferase [Nitrospirota bacterium]